LDEAVHHQQAQPFPNPSKRHPKDSDSIQNSCARNRQLFLPSTFSYFAPPRDSLFHKGPATGIDTNAAPALVRELKMDNKTVAFQGALGLDFVFRNFCMIDCGDRRIYLRGSRPSAQQVGALQESLRRSGFTQRHRSRPCTARAR
jgi:hypothetical protein